VGYVDAQRNEGRYSLARGVTDLCPTAGLPLVDARCDIKGGLGLGAKGGQTRWNCMHHVAEDMGRDGINHYKQGLDILAEVGRWSSPPAAIYRLPAKVVDVAFAQLQPS
jgi:hypothetical protein